ncbi:MAG: LysR family transcriptional regulator [Parvibaculum sp.]
MVDLRLLKHFETVFRLGSFSKAADALGLTHSALTKSIKTLEEAWDVRLFNRTTRLVAPTEAGRRLFPMAVDLLAFADNVRAETKQGARELKIVSGPAILESFLHKGILAFRDTHPATRIAAETMPPALAIEELIQRRVQLLLYHHNTVAGLPYANRLRVRELLREPYQVVFRPGHPVLKAGMSLEALLTFDWAIAGFDAAFEAALPPETRTLLATSGFPRYRLLSQAACFAMVERSDLITAAPRSAVAQAVAEGRLAAAPHPSDWEFSMCAVTLVETGTEPTVLAFIDALERAVMADVPTSVHTRIRCEHP